MSEHSAENRLILSSGATPLTVADAIIREGADKDWLNDVIFYLKVYVDRTYTSSVIATKEGDGE